MAMSTQRLIFMAIAMNIIIGIASTAYYKPHEVNFAGLNRSIEQFEDFRDDAKDTSLPSENTDRDTGGIAQIINTLSRGTSILRFFINGLTFPLQTIPTTFNNPIEDYIYATAKLFSLTLNALVGLEIFYIFFSKKVS